MSDRNNILVCGHYADLPSCVDCDCICLIICLDTNKMCNSRAHFWPSRSFSVITHKKIVFMLPWVAMKCYGCLGTTIDKIRVNHHPSGNLSRLSGSLSGMLSTSPFFLLVFSTSICLTPQEATSSASIEMLNSFLSTKLLIRNQ